MGTIAKKPSVKYQITFENFLKFRHVTLRSYVNLYKFALLFEFKSMVLV